MNYYQIHYTTWSDYSGSNTNAYETKIHKTYKEAFKKMKELGFTQPGVYGDRKYFEKTKEEQKDTNIWERAYITKLEVDDEDI